MIVRSVTIGFTRKYSGPVLYENFQIEGSITVDLAPGEEPADAAKFAFPILRAQLRATFQEFKPQNKESKR